MAYSDYGAFTYRDGERRKDKEDVAVFDEDEAFLPSGQRIFANIIKNRIRGTTGNWWQHSQHGVMGDGAVRVACYKQGLPSGGIWFWPEGADAPVREEPVVTVPPSVQEGEEYRWYYDYGHVEVERDFGTGLYRFSFTDAEHSTSGHYEATMTEPDGTQWRCVYDYGFGAGLTDDEEEGKREVFGRMVEQLQNPWQQEEPGGT